jgi:ectoine hydroxylase-related dioxygenase (phytanoyl-CoA dioxygenase family)
MDWVVTVSAASGEIAPETEAAAHAAIDENGCVLLRGMFPPATIEAMHQEYVAQFGTLDLAAMQREAERPGPNRFLQVGDARFDITLRMSGAFARPDVFANGRLLKILGSLLGKDMHLSNFTVVASHPESTKQHVHRDHPHLFLNPGIDPSLPVYAINVAVPLIDVDIETGPTGVWLGSHRWPQDDASALSPPTVCSWQRGDCMLLDYRTLHAGLPNRSGRVRPIVYMVYARRWFFDHGNHVRRIPLDMPLEHYNEIPASVRPLLIRAFSYATLTRWGEVDAHARAVRPSSANAPSLAGRVGRNDPCPCGAGKKYKHCHGRLA